MTIRLSATLALLGAALATVPAAQAQQPARDARWDAWVGCWEPIAPDGSVPTELKGLRVCVVPANGAQPGVDIVNVTNGKVAERTRVVANGERRPIGREGCTGVESARWSPDAGRVYLNAELDCDAVRRTTSGILAFSPNGEWLDVQGVTAGQNSGVHVARYRALTDLAEIPAEVRQVLPQTRLAIETSRAALSGTVSPDQVVDATRAVAAPVVEAWLVERREGFKLTGKQLVALADAGVPARVTDLMVALSYPKQFAIAGAPDGPDASRTGYGYGYGNDRTVAGRTVPVTAYPVYGYSPFVWGPYGSYSSWYGYGRYGRYGYGYGPYAYGYGPYPYGGYYGGGGYYGWTPPIVIVRPSDGTNGGNSAGYTTRPHLVKGGGYTEGRAPASSSPSTSSGGSSGGSGGGASSSGSSGGSGSSAGSSSSGGGASSSGGERTAKPRTP